MTTKEKKYYILYKVKRDSHCNIIDLIYQYEYNNYNDIQKDTHIHKSNIKKMINKSYNNNINTFKDYCIIKE